MRPSGIAVIAQRFGEDLDAVARLRGQAIVAVFHADRIDEVLVQVVDKFDYAVFQGRRRAQIVKGGQVLHVLAEAHAAGVRADRNAEFRGQQDDGEVLVHAGQAAAVDLANVHRLSLHELLKHDAILAVLAGGDADAGHFAADARVAEDVVRAGRLFHPPGVERLELADPQDGFFDIPFLIGVHHEKAGVADLRAEDMRPAPVVVGIAADLELEMRESGGQGLIAQAGNLLVAEAEPAGRGGVGGQALGAQNRPGARQCRHAAPPAGRWLLRV